jgi:hypothetical protein
MLSIIYRLVQDKKRKNSGLTIDLFIVLPEAPARQPSGQRSDLPSRYLASANKADEIL